MKGVRDKRWDNLAPPFTSEQASRLRKGQLDEEVQMAKQMEQEGYQMFSPTVVCDRVAVKDGKVFFVEFKRPKQKLRVGQQTIHDLVPEQYLIRYSD
jgi:hypothetical protein